MSVLILLTAVWFLLPLLSMVVEHLTTPALARVSVEIDGFWDSFDPTKSPYDHTTTILMMDDQELAELNADAPLSSAVEPPKGNWKNE